MRKRLSPRRRLAFAVLFVVATAAVIGGASLAAFGSGSAAYTTAIDDGSGSPAGCLDSPNGINCNNYQSKDDVYVNGGPTSGPGLPEGSYYFSVLVPGYQHDGFIDGHKGNLSDTTSGGTTGDNASGDSFLCRELTVDDSGGMTYEPDPGCTTAHATGSDVQGNTVTQLMPYDDTSNGGGVYILAICKVGATSSRDCKFDAFRVPNGEQIFPANDLTVSKTAKPTFTREFPWTIRKTACLDGTSGTTCATSKTNTSGVAKFNYVVTVTKDAGADTGWDVTGVITVTNPNDFDVSGVTVTDQITYLHDAVATPDPSADCAITAADDGSGSVASDGTNQTIPANGAIDYTYDCPFTAVPAATSETNTASASWPSIDSPNTSASFDVAVNWTTPTTVIHNKVTVSDVITSTVPSTLPSGFIVGNPDPSTGLPDGTTEIDKTTTYNYSRTLTAPHGCLTVNNQATFNVTDPEDTGLDKDDSGSATATAQVCRVPVTTGALTMGFWQNKNGQTIINKYGGTNCAAVKTWLAQFNPFKDDSSVTSCGNAGSTSNSTMVGYVYNIIKAATCSGPTAAPCDKMLRAQMLATSLDVYFSASSLTPTSPFYAPAGAETLGGNRIGAPSAIGAAGGVGAVTIDLTQICRMIDGSGGTATCSGTYDDASSAFGGHGALQIIDMLFYENSVSTANTGTTWYGASKTLQVLAKNAFDSINNQVAFGTI
jgi:hypothetical protein